MDNRNSSSPDRKGWYQKNLLLLCLFALIGIAVYLNSFDNSFKYDDHLSITSNSHIRTLKNVPSFFTDPKTMAGNPYEAGHYRPLVVLSYAINYAIGGYKPAGYHFVNLAFHIGAAFLVFLIVKAMLGSAEQRAEDRRKTQEVRSQTEEARSKKQEARNETEEARREQAEARSKTEEARNEQTEARSEASEVRSKKQDAGEQIPPGPPLLKGGWIGHGFFVALTAGLIFLVHPFNSEAINYITARSSVMSGFFYLLGFWCWVKFRSKKQEARREEAEARSQQQEARSKKLEARNEQEEARREEAEARSKMQEVRKNLTSNLLPLTSYFYLFSLLAFVAGMLSKEVVITLPVAMWLYDLYILEKPRRFALRTYMSYLPFILIVLIPYLIIRSASFEEGVLPQFKRDFITQIFTVVPVLVKHWQMFVWPGGLTLVHDVPIFSMMTLPVLFSVVLLIIYIGTAVYLVRSNNAYRRIASFFMFWFFIVLLPIIVIPLNAIFQENRGYLGIVSFAVFFSIIAVALSRRMFSNGIILRQAQDDKQGVMVSLSNHDMPLGAFSSKKAYKSLIVFISIVLIIYSAATIHRNTVWGDDLRFWKDVNEKAPRMGVGYAILAVEYKKQGKPHLTMETLQKGLSIEPGNFHLRLYLGEMYQGMGKIDLAIAEYEKALAIDPRIALLWNDLAILYTQKGDIGRAELSIRKGIAIWKDMPKLQFTFGVILGGQGKLKEAEEAFRRAVNANPGFLQARYELGDTLEKLGRADEAIEQYREIIAYTPSGQDVEMIKSQAAQRLARMRISE